MPVNHILFRGTFLIVFDCHFADWFQLLSGSQTLSMVLSCSAQDRDSQEVLLRVFVFTCAHDCVSSQVSWLSIQSNGITAVVGPHNPYWTTHTLSVWSLRVCAGAQQSSSQDWRSGWRRKTWRLSTGVWRMRWYIFFLFLLPFYAFSPSYIAHWFSFCAGVEWVSAVPMEAGSGGFRWSLYRRFSFPAALLDAWMVCEGHLHTDRCQRRRSRPLTKHCMS